MPKVLNPSLFSVELRTDQWAQLVAWYRDTLGFASLLRVDADQYALLSAGTAKLAILGRANPGPASARWSLALEVGDLDQLATLLASGPVQLHPEGYRYVKATDPDGNRLTLIAWPQRSK